ncbi:MAG: hypothetical protein HYV16_02985 [Gammaproteobacteria bacterium]|nr:hypothetical protein [Gammaproteobacteria bacterium]
MDLARYLGDNFLTLEQISAESGCPVERLREYINAELIPRPSYVVESDGRFSSQVFGETRVALSTAAWYFPQATLGWIRRAEHALEAHGPESAKAALKAEFRTEFFAALEQAAPEFRIGSPLYTANGASVNRECAQQRFEVVWEHFLAGTFGVCVREPDSVPRIVAKELTQDRLTAMTENGGKQDYGPEERAGVLGLIRQYLELSMPFSPVEYPRSSKKRLADDVLPKLGAETAG